MYKQFRPYHLPITSINFEKHGKLSLFDLKVLFIKKMIWLNKITKLVLQFQAINVPELVVSV